MVFKCPKVSISIQKYQKFWLFLSTILYWLHPPAISFLFNCLAYCSISNFIALIYFLFVFFLWDWVEFFLTPQWLHYLYRDCTKGQNMWYSYIDVGLDRKNASIQEITCTFILLCYLILCEHKFMCDKQKYRRSVVKHTLHC